MTPAMVPIAIGSLLTTVPELDALPTLSVIMADPDGRHLREEQRRMVLQKRSDFGSEPSWYAARKTAPDDPAESAEDRAVHGQHFGPFLVLWLPLDADESKVAA